MKWIIDRKNIKVEDKFKDCMKSRRGDGRIFFFNDLGFNDVICHTSHKLHMTVLVLLQITNPKVIW